MKKKILRVLIVLWLIVFFFVAKKEVLAAQCGINIDPANGAGFPSGQTLRGVGWVRIEYKDCSTESPSPAIPIYEELLREYKANGIKTLVILDYLTYPEAANNIEAFANRAGEINKSLGHLIDAYEIWNEPDLAAQYILSPSHFAQVANAVIPKLGGKTTVLGGFGSGQPSYLTETLRELKVSYSAVGIHPYGKKVGGYWPDWNSGEMVHLVNEYKTASGGKPIWITEIGIDTDRDDISAEYLKRVFSANVGAQVIIWFAWSDGMVPPFGITYANQQPKTAYTAFFKACGLTPPGTITTKPPIKPPGGEGCGGGGNWVPGWTGQPPQPGEPPISIYLPGRERSRVIFNDYITYPLVLDPKLSISNPSSNKDVIIGNMVKDQGYQVSCATPPLFVSKKIAGEWRRYFEIHSDPLFEELMEAGGDMEADMSQAQIMMFRGNKSSANLPKNSSYEAYFGTLGQGLSSIADQVDPIQAGVANSLLTLEQQCTLKISNLSTAQKLCNTLEDPSKCALKTLIAGTEYYLFVDNKDSQKKSLLNAVVNSGLSCADLSQGWNSTMGVDKDSFTKLQNGLFKAPINLDKIYRYAFLVISLPQDTDDEVGTFFNCDNSNPLDRFWFLNKLPMAYDSGSNCSPWYKNQQKDIPIFIAFKIPDFTTNKSNVFKFSDSAEVVKNTLLLKENQDANNAESDQLKDNLANGIIEKQQIHWKGTEEEKLILPINCSGTPQCEGAHGDVIMRQALVDIINGSMVSCAKNRLGDYKSLDYKEALKEHNNQNPLKSLETANSIYSLAFQTQDEADLKVKNEYNFNQALIIPPVTESENFGWGLRLNLAEAQKATVDNPGENADDVEVRFHIVAPIGINLEHIQQSLMFAFNQDNFNTLIESNCLPDSNGECGKIAQFFPINDALFKFNSSDTVRYQDGCNCLPQGKTYNDLNATEKKAYEQCAKSCQEKSFTLSLEDNFAKQNSKLFFTGAKLGFMIRKLQETLREFGTSGYEYVKSCQRVEDLFLGRCGRTGEIVYGPDGLPYNGGNDFNNGQTWGPERCQAITSGNSPCHVDNLKQKLVEWAQAHSQTISGEELMRRATNASIVCKAESSGNPATTNQRCLPDPNVPPERRTVDYSMGLFQINMLAHQCHHLFSGYGWGDANSSDPIKKHPWCEIKSGITRQMVDDCARNFLDPDYNIAYALNLSQGFANFRAWSTAKLCAPHMK